MADRPKRIQRRRTKGWRMPEGAVYVGRPTKWGNPYVGEGPFDHERMAELFRAYLQRPEQDKLRADVRAELRGRDLVCWCPLNRPCHADVLLELANAPDSETTSRH